MVEGFLRFGIERTKVIFDEQLVPDQNQLNNLKNLYPKKSYSRSKVGRSLTLIQNEIMDMDFSAVCLPKMKFFD